VTKESEQVLVKDWITTAGWVEEGGIKISIKEKYCDCTCQNRQGKQQQEGGQKNGSNEEGHDLVP